MENIKDNPIIIDFEPISRRFNVTSLDKTLYEILLGMDIRIRAECRGKGTCGKCRLQIQEGNQFLNPPTKIEQRFILDGDIEDGVRLACQTKIKKTVKDQLKANKNINLKIYLPENILIDNFQILTSGIGKGVELNPAIKKYFLKIPKPSFDNQVADLERIICQLSNQYSHVKIPINIEYNLLKKIPKLLNDNNSEITLTIWNGEKIINLEQNNLSDKNYGIAFDIGTTTLVGYLLNLNNKKIYAVDSKLNPQTQYGEDVISRIAFIKENPKGLEILQSCLIKEMNKIIFNTCKNVNINPHQISEASIVGNSVMHHIFLGLNPIQIGISPYIPIIQNSIDIKARTINLNILKNGNVHILPLFAGFVGADTMGVIISSKIYEENELTLIIDIGTNGEIIIGNKDILAVGSCAAGSALEGAHIKHGMRAAAGAIDSVKIDPKNLEISYTTIRNKKPIGICGSGLIDIVAEMLRAKILTRSGSFSKEIIHHKNFIDNSNVKEYIIVNEHDTPLNRQITISLADIRQIQMAKAAFYSGIKIMIKHLFDHFDDNSLNIEKVLLAGAFGNYIDKENTKFIGMIPDINKDNILQIGNAAGIGAQYSLLDINTRKIAKNLLDKVRYIEIARDKNFQREYAEAMYFPHMNLGFFSNLKEYQNIPKR